MYFVRCYDAETQTNEYVPVAKILKIIEGNDFENDIVQLVNGTRLECVNKDFESSLATVVLDQ